MAGFYFSANAHPQNRKKARLRKFVGFNSFTHLGQTMNLLPVKSEQFFGEKFHKHVEYKDRKVKQETGKESRPKMPDHLLSPDKLWVEFYKQADALDVAARRSTTGDTLCTFVHQKSDGTRKFIVANPEVYWWFDSHRPPEQRCSFEVIPNRAPCWLYLDLEYQRDLNPSSNGSKMTSTLMNIFSAYFSHFWKLSCTETNILNLDSTNDKKFSRHLIFCIKNIAFRNNFYAGNFVKKVCHDIIEFVNSVDPLEDQILSSFAMEDLKELFIETDKGKKLFVDTCVYTKNRHFRIYKSTKLGKHSFLNVSSECKYVPGNRQRLSSVLYKEKNHELDIFLDSLVSYFPNRDNLILLEFGDDDVARVKTYNNDMHESTYISQDRSLFKSQYPELDEYIKNYIEPGKVRACKQFENTRTIIYEIFGNRYCENIGRPHKSNNIYIVVDLKAKVFYQKCHDEDCAGFKSLPKTLPEEVVFHFDNETDELLSLIPETVFHDQNVIDPGPSMDNNACLQK